MAQTNLYEGRIGYIENPLTAVAQNGTVVATLPATANGRVIGVLVVDDSGIVVSPLATTHSITIDATAKTVTYKNLAASAFTGKLIVGVLA